MLSNKIREEIYLISFVSIMLDETSDILCKSQLSTVLRYVHESKICERLLRFTDVGGDRTSDDIFSYGQQ